MIVILRRNWRRVKDSRGVYVQMICPRCRGHIRLSPPEFEVEKKPIRGRVKTKVHCPYKIDGYDAHGNPKDCPFAAVVVLDEY